MSTATIPEPLRAVPPRDEMKAKFSALLIAKEAAHRAFDAIMSVPRKAAGFVARLVRWLHLTKPLGWLAGGTSWARKYLRWASTRLGTAGRFAAAASAVTSSRGQAVIRKVARGFGRALHWCGRTAYKAVDAGLRLFGKPGNKAADAMFDTAVKTGGWL